MTSFKEFLVKKIDESISTSGGDAGDSIQQIKQTLHYLIRQLDDLEISTNRKNRNSPEMVARRKAAIDDMKRRGEWEPALAHAKKFRLGQ